MVTNIEERPGYDSSQFVAGKLSKITNYPNIFLFFFRRHGRNFRFSTRIICNRIDRCTGKGVGHFIPQQVHRNLQGKKAKTTREKTSHRN